jgi:hypothetical protein
VGPREVKGVKYQIVCAPFSLLMADQRDLKLWNASLSFRDVHIVGTEGSNYFPMSYRESKRNGGC